MRIGLLGGGTIGYAVARALAERPDLGLRMVMIADQSETPLVRQIVELHNCVFARDARDFVRAHPDWVIEAAGQEAVQQYAVYLLDHGVNLVLMSVGALVDHHLLNEVRERATARSCRVRIPSGAIGCLDVLRSAQATLSLDEVTVTTSKPPIAWEGAPYLTQNRIDLRHLESPLLMYDGPASEAIKAFPKNVNVVAAVCLAGIGFERTQVRAVADPHLRENIHHVLARGAFGEMELTLRNTPSPENPRTSFLAASSAIAACLGLQEPLQIGIG